MKGLRQFFLDIFKAQNTELEPIGTVGGSASNMVQFQTAPKGTPWSSASNTDVPQQLINTLRAMADDHEMLVQPLGFKPPLRVVDPKDMLGKLIAEYGDTPELQF